MAYLRDVIQLVCPFFDTETLLSLRSLSSEVEREINEYLYHYTGGPSNMLTQYIGEDLRGDTRYLTCDEKDNIKLSIVDGKFYMHDELFTSGDQSLSSPMGRSAHLFAIDLMGNFYVHTQSHKIHHSSMLSGAPVICAGFLKIENGILVYISNASGHYRPKCEALLQTMSLLISKNIKPNSYTIGYEKPQGGFPRPKTGIEYLKIWLDSVPVALKPMMDTLQLTSAIEDV